MAEPNDGPDTSSIKPISSLRDRFERLGKSSEALVSPSVGQRQAALGGGLPIGSDKTTPPTGDTVGQSRNGGSDVPSAVPRARKSPPPGLQQQSQAVSLPPQVTIDSPRSPPRNRMPLEIQAPGGASPATPLTPSSASESPTRGQFRPISRATTPALEARMSAFLQMVDSTKVPQSPSASSPVANATKAPPPVNRAAKPQVPSKPIGLGQGASNALAAPDNTAELSDRSASPFNTPPGSGPVSPELKQTEHVRNGRNGSIASSSLRSRHDSDASWVEHVRGDSDASIHGRFRASSNASWVERVRGDSGASSKEPSSIHEGYFAPAPIHHAVAARRRQESPPRGLSRTATLPARPVPFNSTDGSHGGDSPEDRPSLPTRPVQQVRSGRTSPPKSQSSYSASTRTQSGRTSPVKGVHGEALTRRSVDSQRPSAAEFQRSMTHRIPAMKPAHKSALNQGFDRSTAASEAVPVKHIAPEVPAPRRSIESRRRAPSPPPPPRANGHSADDFEEPIPAAVDNNPSVSLSDFPDSSRANRRPPRYPKRPWQIPVDYDTKLFATCGEFVVTTGYLTKAWSLRTGEQLLNMAHNENVKVTALVFKPSTNAEDEGRKVWLGTSIGELHEVDIHDQALVKTKAGAHGRREIIKMFRHASQLWTLDDAGDLNVWSARNGMPSLDSQYNSFRVKSGHTFSMACGGHLWIATGHDIRVYKPGAASDTDFFALREPLSQPNTGNVTAGATVSSQPDVVYFGHADGKVSIYNRHSYSCVGIISVSLYRISSMAGVGDYIWAGYNTGMAYVYDMSTNPWTVKKDWQAHEKPIAGIIADQSAMWKMDRLHVVTLGTDYVLRVWDGILEDDWLESHMQEHDSEYCTFSELTATVLTWNAGASKPSHLQHTKQDNNFFREYLTAYDPPDIFVFGFQEIVDLEDKKVTAKSFFKSKKKDPTEQEHMSHAYRAWRDHLTRCIDECLPPSVGYTLLHTASMVGLFSCVFVKASLRSRIHHVHTAEIKRGMGGLHGNKGALVMRFVIDDSSICLLNCHLAAGQTQTMHRNNDVAAILEAEALPSYPLSQSNEVSHGDVFTSGGDGSMVLDHEICILNGDLNYRIDTMGRDTVIKHVNQGNLNRLLERDQLLLSRRKNPGFRLRAFNENTITFAPTYKYNVQTDEYDTSEKRRAPAWCDRILYRGLGKVRLDDYRRWEVRVSDHRPVSGRLRLRVKTVDRTRRDSAWQRCLGRLDGERKRIARAVQLDYLTNTFGMSPKEAAAALQA